MRIFNKSKSKPSYIIIDFTAKLSFTHQSPLIQRYSEIISTNLGSLLTLLPKFADRTSFSDLCGDKKFILSHSIYGPKPGESVIRFLATIFFSKILKMEDTDTFLKTCIRRFQIIRVTLYLVLFAYSKDKPQTLLFPTADPLSVELLTLLSQTRLKHHFKFRIRMVGSESRGLYGHKNVYIDLEKLARDDKCNILIGYETNKYKDFLIVQGISPKVLMWSPWPVFSYSTPRQTHENRKVLRVGFIGGAKKRKGFDLIPQIINLVNKFNLRTKFIIQEAVYTWPEYIKTINEIKSSHTSECVMLESFITTNQLIAEIASLDCLILPYDPTSYAINASGILYHGSDLMTPAITFSGVGFEDEIIEFGLGIIVDSIEEIPSAIVASLSCPDENFIYYNSKRTFANNNFLSNL